MKVLYFNKAINTTEGAAIHARELLEGFKALDISVYCYPQPKEISYSKQSVSATNRDRKSKEFAKEVARLCRGIINTVKDYFVLRNILKKEKYDFIFSRNFEFNIAGLLAQQLLGVPLLLEVNALQYLERKRYGDSIFIPIRKVFEKLNIEGASSVYVVSKELITILSNEGIHPKLIKTIPNGVNLIKFNKDNLTAIDKYVDEKYIVIGFVGSFKSWHGIDVLIDAFNILIHTYNNIKLLIVGDGDTKQELYNKVQKLGMEDDVIFAGKVKHKNMPSVLNQFDIAVAPYKVNGDFYFSPLKVYEYLAMGKPVVCSDIGQLKDLFRDGQAGITVKPNDPESLAKGLSVLIGNDNKRITMAANAIALANMNTWEVAVNNVVDLYKESVSK